MNVKWYEWCRLCARGDASSLNIDLGSDSDFTSISTAIGKYFWVNIKATDLNKYVCQDCYTLIDSLISFTERVNKVQAMFLMLQNTKSNELDPLEVRSQFDLFDEDWEHIIKNEQENHDVDIDDQEFETLEQDNQIEDSNSEEEEMDTDQHFVNCHSKFDYSSENDELKYEMESREDLIAKTVDETIKTDIGINQEHEESDERQAFKEDFCEKDINVENDEQDVSPQRRKLSCSDSEKSSTDPKSFKVAAQSQETGVRNTPKYRCKTCGKSYKNAASYRKHVESHNLASDLPDFMCDECGKVLATERQLSRHKRTHLPLEEKLTVVCPHCNKKYINEAVMKHHVIHMHTEQSYVCEECGVTLKRLSSLREHKLTHTNVLAFKCELCDKGFKNKTRLKAHMDAVHSNTTYPCSQCELTLNSKRTLKMHMLVHTNEKKYKCNFCGISFKRGKSLKNHLIIHIGLRPYKCNFCEKTFTNGSNCRAHKRKIHPLELEADEAAGHKNISTVVPNLYELRASESIQEPRPSNRNRGMTPKMRALLVAAEQLESDLPKSDIKHTKRLRFSNDSTELQEVAEIFVENNEDCLEQEVEGETLVFEVIDEDVL